jgi:hypothetical protein
MAKGDSADEEHDSGRKPDHRDDSGGFSFTLPPIKLPDLTFPRDLGLRLPPPGHDWDSEVRPRNVLVVAVLVDLLDAALLFVAGPALIAWIRAVAGTGLALVLVGLPGLLYAWEGLAVLAGVEWLSGFPSATALVLARSLR